MNQLVIDAARERLAQLHQEATRIEKAIREAEQGLELRRAASRSQSAPKRVMSPEARQRIADAQTKRWAAFRKGKVA